MKKIMILDNDLGNLDVLSLLFIDEGYEVSRFSSASGILKHILSLQPQVIFIDILLGNANGIEICRKLKGDPHTSSIKLILMSASNESLKEAMESECADGYLAKPYDIDIVAQMAKEFLE